MSPTTLVGHKEKAQQMSFETLSLSRVRTWEGLQALGSHPKVHPCPLGQRVEVLVCVCVWFVFVFVLEQLHRESAHIHYHLNILSIRLLLFIYLH